jgi:type VI secretion system secreted protein VgrG
MKVSAITGNADCRGFRAGMRFTLVDHEREECNDTYLIVSVSHGGGHASAGGGDRRVTYRNSFSLLPSATISFFAPAHEHKATPMHGIITAPIEANGSDYASLDESGRYKVRFPFDISDNKNYDASKYVRLAQPYSGANYGIHFPSHEGAEMVLACIDGDLDKPLGIGTVPNANTTSPVVSANKEQNVIRTAGKNEIVLDDTDGKQKIRITTAAKNTVNFDDENRLILMQTTDGNKLLIDDKNTLATLTANNHNLTMSYKDGEESISVNSAKGHLIKIDDAEKKLTIQTAAGHIIQLDDDGKKIMMTDCNGENKVTLDGSNGLSLDSKGKVTITAAKDLEIKGANIALEATKGKVTIKASQDVTMSGMNIEGKASVGLKLKGTNVEAAADAQMKIKGGATAEFASDGMTTVKGGAMLTLKGTMVMIN